MFTLRAFFFDILILKLTVMPNKSPEATRVGRFFLFIKGFWLLGIAGRGCLSFFR